MPSRNCRTVQDRAARLVLMRRKFPHLFERKLGMPGRLKGGTESNLRMLCCGSQKFRDFRVGHHDHRFALESSLILFPEDFVGR